MYVAKLVAMLQLKQKFKWNFSKDLCSRRTLSLQIKVEVLESWGVEKKVETVITISIIYAPDLLTLVWFAQ